MPRLPVHPLLRSRVASVELVTDDTRSYEVLPTSAVVLGLQIVGRLDTPEGALAPAGVTGLQSGPRVFRGSGPSRSILVRFTAQGAACLGVAVDELSDRSTALADLLPPARVAELLERVQGAPRDTDRLRLVEDFLLGLPLVEDRLVAEATRRLVAPGAPPRVADVAAALGVSERQLARRVIARVGRPPRELLSLARFERAVGLIRAGVELTEVAILAGYADQPHMNREFRRFAGAPPGRVRAQGGATGTRAP